MKKSSPWPLIVVFLWCTIVPAAQAESTDQGAPPTTESLAETVRQQQAMIDALQRRLAALEARVSETSPLGVAATTTTPAAVPPVAAIETPKRAVASSATPTIKLRGRLNADAWAAEDGTNGTELRRARLGVEGRINERINYVLEADFAGNSVSLQDVMADYRFSEALRVRMGYHKVPFSLDDQTSENYNLFMEHPIGTTAFVPGRGVGASVLAHGNRWFTQVGVYGEGENDGRDGNNDENLTVGGRFVFAPVLEPLQYVHLGAAAYRTTYAGPPTLRLRERPARHLAPYVIDTQAIDADAMTAYGVEAAWARGPVGVAAEAVQARISGAGNDLDYGGYDIEAWWTLTGEFRPYKLTGGTFDRLIPTRAAGDGGWGAWQLALRTSHLDLNDAALSAGDLTTHSLALNWYWDSRARLMFELDRSEVGLPAGSYWQTAYGMRVQVDW